MATRFNNDSTDCATNSNRPLRASAADVAPKSRRFRKQGRVLALLAGLGLTLIPNTGCSVLTNLQTQFKNTSAIDDFLVDYRNDTWAAKAWHCRKHRFGNRRNLKDLEAGFRAGYMAIAEGGNGCVPAVCPQAYWGFQYQDCNGQSRMNSWFEGYPLGVAAAEEDGIGHWSQVPTSIPMPAPVPPMAPMGAAAVGGAAMGAAMAPAAEPIQAPVPDPAVNQVAPDAALKAPAKAPAPKTDLKPAPADAPLIPVDPAPLAPAAPKAPEPLKVDKPAANEPVFEKLFDGPAEPVAPKPNDDPFGFN